jgi:hypothetical protein
VSFSEIRHCNRDLEIRYKQREKTDKMINTNRYSQKDRETEWQRERKGQTEREKKVKYKRK